MPCTMAWQGEISAGRQQRQRTRSYVMQSTVSPTTSSTCFSGFGEPPGAPAGWDDKHLISFRRRMSHSSFEELSALDEGA